MDKYVQQKSFSNDHQLQVYMYAFMYFYHDTMPVEAVDFFLRTGCLGVQKWGRTKKVIKVGIICGTDNILTVQEKWLPIIGKKTERSLEMTPHQREL